VNGLLTILAINASTAALLALVVAAVSRYVGRPAVTHALWLLVLLELLVPPLVEIAVLPRSEPPAGESAPMASRVVPSAAPIPVLDASASVERGTSSKSGAQARPTASTLIGAAWLLGVIAVVGLAAIRLRRFRRLIAGAATAPPGLQQRLDRLVRRMGLRRRPDLRLVPGRVSPLLLHRPGRLELLIPTALLPRLNAAELDALLVHELAHVKRRDYWVRYVELAAQALFWWHPVAWWARARLRRVEEQCCDGLVVRTLPDRAGDYARGLLKTVEFLAGHGSGLPALASGMGEVHHLEERLTIIVRQRHPRSLTAWQKTVLALAASALLLVFPTWADRAPEDDVEQRDAQAGDALQLDLLDLEREAQELESQLNEVRARQMELQMQLEHERQEREIGQLGREIERLEAAGRSEDADALRREQERMQRQIEIGAVHVRLEQEHMRQRAELELPLQRLVLELETARSRGEEQRVAELERLLAEREHELQMAQLRAFEEQRALEHDIARQKLEQMLIEREFRHAEGRSEAARQAEQQMAQIRLEIESLDVRARGAELERLHAESVALEHALQEQGPSADYERALRDIEERIIQLKEQLDNARANEY